MERLEILMKLQARGIITELCPTRNTWLYWVPDPTQLPANLQAEIGENKTLRYDW